MGYSLGIDVGTTFTAAAVWRDGRVEVVGLEAHQVTVPTVIAAGEDIAFGVAALSRAAGAPDSLAREFKRRLGDPVPVFMSGAPYSAERLIAMFAKWVTDVVTAQVGEAPERIAVTHPANWTEFQRHLLSTALEQAGLGEVDLLTEPQAAALDFSAAAGLEAGALVLVYDLGGGTFDLALLQCEEQGLTHVGESAGIERLGGIDFDEAVFQHVIGLLPPDVITNARNDPTGRLALAQLRTRCVEAKEALSSSVNADVPVLLPGLSSTIRITRAELEAMIRPMLEHTIELARQVLARSGVGVEALSAVLMVGGSSRIPLVSDLVSTELNATVRVDAHPKLVVARGAARWAATRPARWAPPTVAGATVKGDSSKRRKLIIGSAVVLAIAVGAVVWAVSSGSDKSNGSAATTTQVSTTAVATTRAATTAPSTAVPSTTAAPTTTTAPVDVQPLRTFDGQGGSVTASAFSPDGKFIASGDAAGNVFLWDASTGAQVRQYAGNTAQVQDVAFSPNGVLLASSSFDTSVRLWDVDSGTLVHQLSGHLDRVNSVEFSVDGKELVTASNDKTAIVWDVDTGGTRQILRGHEAQVIDAHFSRDGATVVTSSVDQTARTWNVASGATIATMSGSSEGLVEAALSPDGSKVATISHDDSVRLYDAVTGSSVWVAKANDDMSSVHFSPDGSGVLTSSNDHEAVIWDAVTGKERVRFRGHQAFALSAMFNAAGSQVVTASADGTAKVWDTRSGSVIETLVGSKGFVLSASFSPDGRQVATENEDGTVRLYDVT